MKLPFCAEDFMQVFVHYNTSVWPMQLVLNGFAAAAIAMVFVPAEYKNRIISGFLAFLWGWTGIAYHHLFFSSINKAAYLFGVMFVLQGFLLFYYGVIRGNFSFRITSNTNGVIGGILMLYALVLYPLLGYLLGHRYPGNPTFGLPCPSTIFTFGILLWTEVKIPRRIIIIPALWSLIGFGAALSLGIKEDTGLLIAGILGTALLLTREPRKINF